MVISVSGGSSGGQKPPQPPSPSLVGKPEPVFATWFNGKRVRMDNVRAPSPRAVAVLEHYVATEVANDGDGPGWFPPASGARAA